MTPDQTQQEELRDFVSFAQALGYRNPMYLPQDVKDALSKAFNYTVARDEQIKREAIHQKVIHVVESNHSDPNGIAEELLYDYKAITQSSQQSEESK